MRPCPRLAKGWKTHQHIEPPRPQLQSRPSLMEPCPPPHPAEPKHQPSPPPGQALLPVLIPDQKPVDAPQKATTKTTPSPNTGACNLKPKHCPSLATVPPPCEMRRGGGGLIYLTWKDKNKPIPDMPKMEKKKYSLNVISSLFI